MAVALAMGGLGLGPVSLILQVVDECVKYYKYFSEASQMPEKHRYLQLRLQLEQQQFLVFVEEAGLLSTETGFETLSINSTLLQETLSEIRTLFEMFQQANGKYVDIVLPDGPEKKLSPQPSMMELLCATQAPIAKIDISVVPTANTSLRWDSIFRRLIWKARNLPTYSQAASTEKAETEIDDTLNSSLLFRTKTACEIIRCAIREVVESDSSLTKPKLMERARVAAEVIRTPMDILFNKKGSSHALRL
uniref:Prion-inhibition and propagation HeLo domain-containing protein n=1 Tax=Bionectria ochroleuca TaxID=29856 RepID=A0A8H7N3R9_BIOOC